MIKIIIMKVKKKNKPLGESENVVDLFSVKDWIRINL